MIDFNSEHLISFSEAAARQPLSRSRRPCSAATVWRGAMIGIKARDGIVVKLEWAKIGGRLITSIESIQRFSDRLSAGPVTTDDIPDDASAEPATCAPRTATKRRRASEKAAIDLTKIGI